MESSGGKAGFYMVFEVQVVIYRVPNPVNLTVFSYVWAQECRMVCGSYVPRPLGLAVDLQMLLKYCK